VRHECALLDIGGHLARIFDAEIRTYDDRTPPGETGCISQNTVPQGVAEIDPSQKPAGAPKNAHWSAYPNDRVLRAWT
jgi:hypothetical protein